MRNPRMPALNARPWHRAIVLLAATSLVVALAAGCGEGGELTPAGGGTDVNDEPENATTTTVSDPREASDGNSGAGGSTPGPDSDAGVDDGGQGTPAAPEG